MSAVLAKEMAKPISSAFPTFQRVSVPADVRLNSAPVTPVNAWHGLIRPFETDSDARLVSRLLAADRPVDVHGGYLIPPDEAQALDALPLEELLSDTGAVFEVVVLQFAHTVDPWAFSLSPPISRARYPLHPHLRGDREMFLQGELLTGLCIYSAAEFDLRGLEDPMTAYLNQVSIYLGKQVVWDKTKRLITGNGQVMSPLDAELYSSIPAETVISKIPKLRAMWNGQWIGRPAVSGVAHLGLDPNGRCWCGEGKLYKDCHLPFEARAFANLASRPLRR